MELVSPRDIYAALEAIWISKPASSYFYIAKRAELEQKALEIPAERLDYTVKYTDFEIKRMQRRLANMKAINSILKEIQEDSPIQL